MGKLTIQSDIDEQTLMEGCLNQKYSGFEYQVIFMFYALLHQWHIDKFTYYWNLLQEEKNG